VRQWRGAGIRRISPVPDTLELIRTRPKEGCSRLAKRPTGSARRRDLTQPAAERPRYGTTLKGARGRAHIQPDQRGAELTQFGRFLAQFGSVWFSASPHRPVRYRLLTSVLIGAVGVVMLLSAARADEYLHRGIESGDETPHVAHLGGRVLGVNNDLRGLTPTELNQAADSLAENGIRLIRQPFDWSQIEPEPDAFDWSEYDRIVEALATRDIQILAILSNSPAWSIDEDATDGSARLPMDIEDFGIFVDAFTERYAGSVGFIQIWDAPNRREAWGNQPVNPRAYMELLATAATAARQRDPSMRIIIAELAWSQRQGDMDDLSFLQRIYEAGASPYFDAVAVGLPGGSVSPYDRWVDPVRPNMSRAVLYRELMVNMHDATTPIWATSYALAPADAPSGAARNADAFIAGGLRRIREEWPWMGSVVLGDEGNPDELLIPEVRVGTDEADLLLGNIAPPGMIPVEADSITYEGEWSDQEFGETAFKASTEDGAAVRIRFHGTGVSALLRSGPSAGPVRITLDGEPLPGTRATAGATEIDLFRFAAIDATIPLASGLSDEPHEIRIELVAEDGAGPTPNDIAFGGFIVNRDTPSDWPVTLLSGAALGALWYAVREVLYVLALGAGWLRRHRHVDLGPPLSGWEPGRRA
jgi:hypothetical protein